MGDLKFGVIGQADDGILDVEVLDLVSRSAGARNRATSRNCFFAGRLRFFRSVHHVLGTFNYRSDALARW